MQTYSQVEVSEINKQKFLAELGKLLTFMYEEDLKTALAMYSRMFDEAADEQALMSFLLSPTRQAVVIARAYNARERKLQVHTQSREEDELEGLSEETPDFVLAISQVRQNAFALQPEDGWQEPEPEAEPVCEDQLSLFEGEQEDELPAAKGPAAEEGPVFEEEPLPAPAAPEAEEADAENGSPAPQAEEEPAPGDEVDAFLADFSIQGDELIPEEEPIQAPSSSEEEPAREEEPGLIPSLIIDEALKEEGLEPLEPGEELVFGSVRRPKVFLLVLYIILALPIGLVGVALLLVPTLLCLALAVAVVASGSAVLIASFAGFAVFADILVMLGIALVILAFGLLFTWLFVWFIGGAIVGLVKSIIALGRKWCYKEVPAI